MRRFVKLFRTRQQVEKTALDRHRMARSPRVEPADLAGIAVDRQLVLEPIDLVERRQRDQMRFGHAERQQHLERRCHRPPAETQMHRRFCCRLRRCILGRMARTDDGSQRAAERARIEEIAAVHGMVCRGR